MSADTNLTKDQPNPAVDGSELIRFDKVVKRFGANTVLDELDFSVASGKHVTLIGPSGSGKTTILRLLMTLLKPDEGTIKVGGEYLTHEEKNGKLVPAGEKHVREVVLKPPLAVNDHLRSLFLAHPQFPARVGHSLFGCETALPNCSSRRSKMSKPAARLGDMVLNDAPHCHAPIHPMDGVPLMCEVDCHGQPIVERDLGLQPHRRFRGGGVAQHRQRVHHAVGHEGQLLSVMPSHAAVVLRLGIGQDEQAIKDSNNFNRYYGAKKPAQTAQIAFAAGAGGSQHSAVILSSTNETMTSPGSSVIASEEVFAIGGRLIDPEMMGELDDFDTAFDLAMRGELAFVAVGAAGTQHQAFAPSQAERLVNDVLRALGSHREGRDVPAPPAERLGQERRIGLDRPNERVAHGTG